MRKCIIIGAGDFTPPKSINDGDLIIAADGGLDHAISVGITPHLFIGDMDSLKSPIPKNLECITFPARKDFTDMHLAYLEGKKRDCTDFEIYGGTGGRGDHTFANISLLLAVATDGFCGRMISESQVYTVIKNSKICIKGRESAYISVFALGGKAEDVSLEGLDYEVDGITLTPEFSLGVSNRFTDKEAKISVGSGALLIIYEI